MVDIDPAPVARERAEIYGNRSRLMVTTSALAAGTVPDGSLDMVFLDADHTYKGVKQDIELWWRKVRHGGILAGHDYSHQFPGVVHA
eukprot:1340279-Amphidinium_carterae.1